MSDWLVGMLFSVVVGGVATSITLWAIRLPMGGKQKDLSGVSGWVTGAIERAFFTILVALDVSGTATAMIGWLAVKLASNWNHKFL